MEHSDFRIAWICALPVELAAAQAMLDEVYEDLPRRHQDNNTYKYGRVGRHRVVIACQPAGVPGLASAAEVANSVRRSFSNFKMGLMVGIGGGVPDPDGNDVRLGDVVVSKPDETFGGVVQYDMGKAIRDGQMSRTGLLNRPPDALLTAVAYLEAKHMTYGSSVPQLLSEMISGFPRMRSQFSYQGSVNDKLFATTYEHEGTQSNCTHCDPTQLVSRTKRPEETPLVHYGTIASGNEVMRDGKTRDRIAMDCNALCFEMEAAGLMNSFPCLVIRGICDYADSHKNKRWQPYAAAAAAAFAKELLCSIPDDQITSAPIEAQLTPWSSGEQSTKQPLGAGNNTIGKSLDIRDASGKPKTFFKTPYPSSKNFTGREDYLERMRNVLSPNSESCIAIHGLRGSGKTQTAIKFAELHRSEYNGVFFINASSDEDILSDYDKLHQLLDLEVSKDADRATQVLEWFADSSNEPWLVVFDSADALDSTNLSQFLPRGIGHTVITTQDQGIENLDLVNDAIQLDMMSEDESRRLLLTRAGVKSLPDSELTFVDEIAEQLGFHPLALDSAAAQVRHQRLSFETYLSTFRERQENSRQFLRYRPRMSSYEKAVFDVLDINFDVLRAESSPAYSLLVVFAHLDGASIQFDLLQRGAESQWRMGDNGELVALSSQEGCVDENVLNLLKDRIAFHAAIERLMSLSLIYHGGLEASSSSREVTMHPLVRLHVQSRLAESEFEEENATLCALSLIAQSFSLAHSLEEFARFKPFMRTRFYEYSLMKYTYLPHVRASCQNLERLFQLRQSNSQTRKLPKLKLGSTDEGSRNVLGHVVSLFSEASMVTMRHYGQDTDTSDWGSRFLNIIDTLLEEEDDEYAKILQAQNHISFKYGEGSYKQSSETSMKFFRENYPTFMDQSTSVMPISRVPLFNAELCNLLVRLAEDLVTETTAEAKYAESHRLLSLVRAVDQSSPSTAEQITLQLRARITGKMYKDQGKWADAANALQYFCSICVPGLMDEGWATADRAQCLLEMHRVDEAETLINSLLSNRRNNKKFQSSRPGADGDNDHNLLQINLAESHLRQGKLAVAEAEFQEILASMIGTEISPHDFQTRSFSIYCALARISHIGGSEWAEAKARWEQAVAYGQGVSPGKAPWGREHFYVRVAILSLSDALFELGDVDKAWSLKNQLDEAGAFAQEKRMHWMLGVGTYWLDEILGKWAERDGNV